MRKPTVHQSGETEEQLDIILKWVFAPRFALHPDARPVLRLGGKDFYEDGVIEDPENPWKYLIALVTKDGEILQWKDQEIPFAKVISGPITTSLWILVQLRQTPKTAPGSKWWNPRAKIDAWYNVVSWAEIDISTILNEVGGEVDAYVSYEMERGSWGSRFTVVDWSGKTAIWELEEKNGVFYRAETPFIVNHRTENQIYVQSIHRNFTLPWMREVTQFTWTKNWRGFWKQMFFDAKGEQVRFEVDTISWYMNSVLFIGKNGMLIWLDGWKEIFLPNEYATWGIQKRYHWGALDVL